MNGFHDGVKLGKKVVETRHNFRAVTPQYAKVVAALKRDHRRMLDEKLIAADTTFKDFFAQNCGGALPGWLETLASFFNSMCLVDDPNGKPLLAVTTPTPWFVPYVTFCSMWNTLLLPLIRGLPEADAWWIDCPLVVLTSSSGMLNHSQALMAAS